ncbi:MAG: GNAT family N-acetyltransferase [Rubrivivax sp.]
MSPFATIIEGCGFDPLLLSRIEDAGINASAPPQQRWLDGWLLRFSPGKARRARCINAVAEGRLPWDRKLDLSRAAYQDLKLPLVMRITPFTLPSALDDSLAEAGYPAIDPTLVMVNADLATSGGVTSVDPSSGATPDSLVWLQPGISAYAALIGGLRGSSAAQIAAHEERLQHAPVPAVRWALAQGAQGNAVACGQSQQEGDVVGLYDIHTLEAARGRGYATLVCEHLLSRSRAAGARFAYLQVEVGNITAQRIYRRLGFRPAYQYHYRELF